MGREQATLSPYELRATEDGTTVQTLETGSIANHECAAIDTDRRIRLILEGLFLFLKEFTLLP